MGATLRLTSEEAAARLRTRLHHKVSDFHAMYSSVLGGIVTDPSLMVLPLDDHMVHRGHAVFDTAAIVDGMLYQLDPHLQRLLRSAEMARIPLPCELDELRQIVIDTAAASGQRNASVRYWLSAGPGGFGLSSGECVGSSFYVMIFRPVPEPERFYTDGVTLVTSTVPIKPPFFARVKSNNYLPNVLVLLEARDHGADHGLFLDAEGYVAESSHMNVAFVNADNVLCHPPYDAILTGITAQRMLHLARQLVNSGELEGIALRSVPVEEWRAAREILLFGSSLKVAPVVRWDDQQVGDGQPGPIARKLLAMWRADQREAADQLVPVPYDEPGAPPGPASQP